MITVPRVSRTSPPEQELSLTNLNLIPSGPFVTSSELEALRSQVQVP